MNTSGDTGTERRRALRPWLLRTFVATFVAGLAGAFGGYGLGHSLDAGSRRAEIRKNLLDKYFAASSDIAAKQEQILTFVDMVLAEDDPRLAQWARVERAAHERRQAAPPKAEIKVESAVDAEAKASADSTGTTQPAPQILHITPKPPAPAPLKTKPKAPPATPVVQRPAASPLSATTATAALEAPHDSASLAQRLGF